MSRHKCLVVFEHISSFNCAIYLNTKIQMKLNKLSNKLIEYSVNKFCSFLALFLPWIIYYEGLSNRVLMVVRTQS